MSAKAKTRKAKVKKVDPCPHCGQEVDRPPGFYLDPNGPEAIMDDTITLMHPDVVRCRSCEGVVTIAPSGSISVRKPRPEEL